MSEWEVGCIIQAISMEYMLKKQSREFVIKTVSTSKNPIKTIGGLTITSDIVKGILVGAICGATIALDDLKV